jgi:hypothetical protein
MRLSREKILNPARLESLLAQNQNPLIKAILARDTGYLFPAYEKVESLWAAQFKRIKKIHLVLLSEAPLFGDRECYLYNPLAPVTRFFSYKDYVAIAPRKDFPHFSTVLERKTFLLRGLSSLGILILDIFPFPLNRCTARSYASFTNEEFQELFRQTSPYHFKPKVLRLLRKATPRTIFAFRYERLRNSVGALVKDELGHAGVPLGRIWTETISGKYGVLLGDRLKKAYSAAAKV